MSAGGAVNVTISVDLVDLKRRLLDDEVAILEGHADQNITDIQEAWQGWEYKKIPKNYEPGLSRAEWKRGRSQTTEGVREVEIVNNADHGKGAYAGFVHRAGTPKEDIEAEKMRKLVEDSVPALVDKLTASVQKNADAPQTAKKLKRGTPGPRKVGGATIL